MLNRSVTLLAGVTSAFVLAGVSAYADPLDIHKSDAVRIVFENDLRSDYNEPGDRVFVRVEKDPGLPKDTTIEGLITRIHPANRYRAASMDIRFDTLRLPDGKRFNIEAFPTAENDAHITKGVDGRMVSSYHPGEDGAYVVGGTVGGLILGGIGHRPILGAFVGSIIGSIAGAADRHENANLVIRKGAKMVAVFDEDVAVTANRPQAPVGRRPDFSNGWRRREGAYSRRPAPVPPPPAAAPTQGGTLDINVNGQDLIFDAVRPYRDGSTVMVPVETVADQLSLAATIHDNGSISIDGPDSSVQLHDGADTIVGGTNQRPLSHKVVTKDGVVYVPIEVFSRFGSGAKVTVNGAAVGQ